MQINRFFKVDIQSNSGFPIQNQKFIDLLWIINQEGSVKELFPQMHENQFLSSISLSFTSEFESWVDLWRHKDKDSVSASSRI